MKTGSRNVMPPRASSGGVRRRRGGRRGGSSTASARHRQASVKAFFSKTAPPSEKIPALPSSDSFVEVPDQLPTSVPSHLDLSPAPSAPSSTPTTDETLNEKRSPSEVPDMPSFEDREESSIEVVAEKFVTSPHLSGQVGGDSLQPLHNTEDDETVSEHIGGFAAPDTLRGSGKLASTVTEPLDVSMRWDLVSLSTTVDVFPKRDRVFVQLPCIAVSIPPKDNKSAISPVTPANLRPEGTEKPEKIPYEALSESSGEHISRLSKRRNLARQAALKAVKYSEQDGIEEDPIMIDDEPDDISDDTAVVVARSKKRRIRPDVAESEKKELHPFFKAAAASVRDPKDRPKRPRIVREPSEAWNYTGATMHVNCCEPLLPWSSPPELSLFSETAKHGHVLENTTHVLLKSYEPKSVSLASKPNSRQVETASICSDMWVDKYKQDRRVDVISATVTKKLVDWLSPRYADKKVTHENCAYSSDDGSSWSSVQETEPVDNERIAVLSGPVGCGKSTVVANAARQLGLTILEINASTLRTGKRIRDAIGEAFRTHRVATASVRDSEALEVARKSNSRKKHSTKSSSGLYKTTAKTLIFFEEVDELQDDEKGFWACLQELAESEECRRPIICTANSFSHQMKQVFLSPKGPIESDFQRLLLHSREEILLNPLSYKHFSFPHRSDRQAAAVLKRVSTSEKMYVPDRVLDYLATSYRADTRRAINLLHLFGLPGLNTRKRRGRSKTTQDSANASPKRGGLDMATTDGFCMVADVDVLDLSLADFHVGSESWVEHGQAGLENSQSRGRNEVASLETWCESLGMMSDADTIRNTADNEIRNRSGETIEGLSELCRDEDIDICERIAGELGEHAVSISRKCISLNEESRSPNSLVNDMHAVNTSTTTAAISKWPLAKRPILTEYIPVLRTMALADSSNEKDLSNGDGAGFGRVVRRTRASIRRSGFCTLDLGATTVSELQREAIRSQP